jgi:uncharacterized membrane protein
MNEDIVTIVVWTCSLISGISLLGILYNRNKLKKGIGLRSIQFACLTVLIPLLIVLVVMEILPVSTIAVVAGAIIGYAFASKENKKVQ